MVEKQVLFRIDSKTLDALDKKITKDGYSTRNAWFKDVAMQTLGKSAGKKKGR